VTTIEELLEWKCSGSGLENRDYRRGNSLRWPRNTLQRLALTSPTSGGRSVGIVRLQTKATEFSFFFLLFKYWQQYGVYQIIFVFHIDGMWRVVV
jgi:hypothetical protein